MVELDLKVQLGGEDSPGLWLEDVASGQRVKLPPAALRLLAEALREAGEEELAGKVAALHRAAVAAQRLEEARQRCMDLTYSQEEYRRCLELLRGELPG